MRVLRALCLAMVMAAGLYAQTPIINPRGVVNAFTQEPAPSRVSPGGLIWINGANLGPPDGAKASGVPWPTRLAEPAIEVRVNNRPAALFSVATNRIVAQIPWETLQGLAQVIVIRGEQQSRPAFIRVQNILTALRTVEDRGYGIVAGTRSPTLLTVAGTGFGPVDPTVATGEAAASAGTSAPRQTPRAFVGGLPAKITAALSNERVGEYDLQIELPAESRPGDGITVIAGNQPPANRPAIAGLDAPAIQFQPLPEGANTIRQLRDADLRGSFVLASAARGEDGCYPTWMFDLASGTSSKVGPCLISAAQNAATASVDLPESSTLAAFVGPAAGTAQEGISSKVAIFRPGQAEPKLIELPGPASTLAGTPGVAVAVRPGTPPTAFAINLETDEVTAVAPGAPGGGAGGGGAILPVAIDLGGGINVVLSRAVNMGAAPGAGGGAANVLTAQLIGNDINQPTAAKLAIYNNRGEVQGTRDLPEGWLPLVPPLPPPNPNVPPGGVQPPGGGALPGGGAPGAGPGGAGPNAGRVQVAFDAATRGFYFVGRKSDNSADAMLGFRGVDMTPSLHELPAGWFATSCTNVVRLFSLELSRRVAILGSRQMERDFANPCPAHGFITLDLSNQNVSSVALPGQGQFNASNNVGDLNDYLFGVNTDPSNRGLADTLYVLDGVTQSAFRMNLPTEVTSFAGAIAVPELSAVLGLATNRINGDAGIVYFDLDKEQSRVFPVPDGFQTVQFVSVMTNNRKIVARGVRPQNTGSQYLIYDLRTGDLAMPPNPEGVAYVGAVPAQPGQGGGGQPGQGGVPAAQYQAVNTKSNTITAVGFNENREPIGILTIRVP